MYASGNIVPAVFGSFTNRPFENWACQGATIAGTRGQIQLALQAGTADDNVTRNQWAGDGLNTFRVQISAGGNDLGFSTILSCAHSFFKQNDTVLAHIIPTRPAIST